MSGAPPLALSDGAVVAACVLGWIFWSLLVGYWGHRLSPGAIERFGSRPPRPAAELQAARLWYERVLLIKAWKDRLPEAGSFFPGGFDKRSLGPAMAARRPGLERFVLETRRAELVHLLIWPFWLITALWCAPAGVLVNLVVGTALNLPCLWVLRYNRLRLQGALLRAPSQDDPPAAGPRRSP